MSDTSPRTIRFSDYGTRALSTSPVSRMMSAFANEFRPGVDINLGVGYVSEQTVPGRAIADAARWVVDHPEEHPHALNYGGPAGSDNLIGALKRFLIRNRIGNITAELLERRQLVIGVSGVTSLLEAIGSIIAPGVVLTTDPMYYIYANTVERLGHRALAVPEDAEGVRVDLLREQAESHLESLSFIYVVTIGNPTSTILSTERRRELVRMARQLSDMAGRAIPLFLDNAYELLIHDPEVKSPDCGCLHDEAGLVYELGTLSKALAPALRIGYLHGPPGSLMAAVVQRTNDIGLSAPLVTQEIAAHLLDTVADEHMRVVQASYREKSLSTRRWLERELGNEIESITGGAAGFYFYLTLRELETAEGSAFYRCATRTTGDTLFDGEEGRRNPKAIYVPGVFFVHPKGELAERGKRQLRISYGYATLEELESGIRILGEAARHARRLVR